MKIIVEITDPSVNETAENVKILLLANGLCVGFHGLSEIVLFVAR